MFGHAIFVSILFIPVIEMDNTFRNREGSGLWAFDKCWQIYTDKQKQMLTFKCGQKINLTINFYFIANDSINKLEW